MSCDDETTCGICMYTYSIPIRMPCGHLMCKPCWTKATVVKPACPFCRDSRVNEGVVDRGMYAKVQMRERVRACGASVSNLEFYPHMRHCDKCYAAHNMKCRRVINKTKKVLEQGVGLKHSLNACKRANRKLVEAFKKTAMENEELKRKLRDNELRNFRFLQKQTIQ